MMLRLSNTFLGLMFTALITLIYIPGIHSQVTADFTADDTLGCTSFTVHFTNTSTGGTDLEFLWTFGGFGTSTLEDPLFTFNSPGNIPVTLKVTDQNTLESDETTKYILVLLTPSASLTIDSTNACVHGNVRFYVASSIDSVLWDFGDGTYSLGLGNYMYHAYEAYGSYNVQCITYRYEECSDTSNYIVKVDGPIADFTINPTEACKNAPIEFTMNPVYDVTSFFWELEVGVFINNVNPVTYSYSTMGDIYPQLTVTGATGSCTIQDTLHIYEVVADFEYADTRCHEQPVAFNNTSIGNDNNYWDFGNGSNSLTTDPIVIYPSGTYIVMLAIENNYNCTDTIEKEIIIHPLPEIDLADNMTVCPYLETMLVCNGGDIIFWTPYTEFDDPTSYTPIITPDSTSTYMATITDTVTHCINSDSITVYVQGGFIQGKITVFPVDTTLIIGDSVSVIVFDSLNRELTYIWSSDNPEMRISCADCPYPTMQPLQSTIYTLVVSDTNQCFQSEEFQVAVEVREEYRIGVPDAFTPNNDQVNDIIKVDGWGIQELIEFRIFNRSGIEVFYTNDISEGWNGYYQDKLQNVDTYSYIIKAKMWDENITTIHGTFSLLR